MIVRRWSLNIQNRLVLPVAPRLEYFALCTSRSSGSELTGDSISRKDRYLLVYGIPRMPMMPAVACKAVFEIVVVGL